MREITIEMWDELTDKLFDRILEAYHDCVCHQDDKNSTDYHKVYYKLRELYDKYFDGERSEELYLKILETL